MGSPDQSQEFFDPVNSIILTRLLRVREPRTFANDSISLLLPIYPIVLGINPFQVGIITTATLIG